MAEVFIYERPAVTVKLKGGVAGSEVEIECHAREVALTAEDTETDIETYCQPGATRPGKTTWTAEILNLQSFGADGLWNLLHPLSRQLCTFTILPNGEAPVGVDNPLATFDAYMPTVPFLTRAAIGEPAEIELTTTTVGAPTFAETAPAGAEAAAGGGDLNGLTVAQLQERAAGLGLATTGTKSELIERISAAEAELVPA